MTGRFIFYFSFFFKFESACVRENVFKAVVIAPNAIDLVVI